MWVIVRIHLRGLSACLQVAVPLAIVMGDRHRSCREGG